MAPGHPGHTHPAFPGAAFAILEQIGTATLIAHDEKWGVIAGEEHKRILSNTFPPQSPEDRRHT